MQLEIPVGEDMPKEYLTLAEEEYIQEILDRSEGEVEIRAMFESDPDADEKMAEEYRKKVAEDFEDIVLRTEVHKWTEPIVRGPYGMAYIPLKEGAVPTRSRPFVMHGEKFEAYKKVAQQWLDMGFVEKPTVPNIEWLSQGFVVPKKSDTFPWRGVADMRGPNSQMRRCGYPLPLIEDILVKQGKH